MATALPGHGHGTAWARQRHGQSGREKGGEKEEEQEEEREGFFYLVTAGESTPVRGPRSAAHIRIA
eukprot:7229772-Pyramimonas_sp.AAC.1